jgi:hypothetical protein
MKLALLVGPPDGGSRSPRPRATLATAVAAALGAALAGCGDPVEAPPAEQAFEVVHAPPARAVPGWPLRDSIVVRLVDDAGQPISGRLVTWSVGAGGGSVVPTQDTTDADGLATAHWTLGASAGANELSARTPDGTTRVFRTAGEALRADQVAAGTFMACGLVEGAAWCWGYYGWTGGRGLSMRPDSFAFEFGAPGRVAGPSNFTSVAVSGETVCALDDAGGVRCATAESPSLEPLGGLPPMRRIVGAQWGSGRYCGLAAADSTAWCWRATGAPAAVPGSPAFAQLAMEHGYTADPSFDFMACGVLADSTAACWGAGPLGDGVTTSSATPVAVAGGHRFAEVVVGDRSGCGRRADGEVWCWGRNEGGQLGSPGPDSPTPVRAATGVSRIAAGHESVLAIRDGAVVRWGGDVFDSPTAVPVASLAGLGVVDFAAGGTGACVRLADRQVHCYDEMWDRSSAFAVWSYSPVHPIVEASP